MYHNNPLSIINVYNFEVLKNISATPDCYNLVLCNLLAPS